MGDERNESNQYLDGRRSSARLPFVPLLSEPSTRPMVHLDGWRWRRPASRLRCVGVERLPEPLREQELAAEALCFGLGVERATSLPAVDRPSHDPRPLSPPLRSSVLDTPH